MNEMIVMKFLLIILVIRYVFHLLDQLSGKSEVDMTEYEDEDLEPSEHNVWW